MSLSPVAKYSLISREKNKDRIIDLLHNFGVMQLSEGEKKEVIARTDENSPEYLFAQVTFALNFLKRYDERKIPLTQKLAGRQPELTLSQLEEMAEKFDYRQVVAACENHEAKLNELSNLIDRHKNDLALLFPWSGLDFVPESKIETRITKTLLGSASFEVYEEILRKTEKLKEVNLLKSREINREVFFAITFHKKLENEIKVILTQHDFKPSQLPSLVCHPHDQTRTCENTITRAEKDREKIIQEIKKEVKYIPSLEIIYDFLAWKKEQKEAKDNTLNTAKTFTLLFWMEERFKEILCRALAKITADYALEKIPVNKGEVVPVVLKNKALVEPFESVTGVYGMPLPSEPDPTPFLAPFFFIFFGFCVSDAGYGLVITLIMSILYKMMKKPPAEKKLIKLLIFGGLSTLVIGALFGSWFGVDISNMSDNWFKTFVLTFKVIDPVKNPITVLLVALAFGILQIMTGLLVNTWWKIKNKKISDGLLGSGLWFFTILSLVLWILTKVKILPTSLNSFFTYLILADALALILANSRKTKNIFLKLPLGLYSLYSAIGYISDTLSYSRLLALGLATGIIAMVINLIAGLAVSMLPFVGYFFALLILIGGHLFNIGINALGAFIHSGRLQFVEFFPKFMEGGGSRFRPFRKQARYIRIINNKTN